MDVMGEEPASRMQTQGVDRGASNAACPITKVHVTVTYNIPAAVLHTSTPSFAPVFVLVHACLVQTAHSKFGVHVPQGETPSRPHHSQRTSETRIRKMGIASAFVSVLLGAPCFLL